MNWIKQHPAQLSLAAISCGVIFATVALYLSAVAFPKTFRAHQSASIPEISVPALNAAPLDQAIAAAQTPGVWKSRNAEGGGRPFVEKVYVRKGDELVPPDGLAFHGNVPNDWLKAYGLDILKPAVLSDDPDHDGFSTQLEWLGMDAVPHSQGGKHPLLDRLGNRLPDDSTSPVDAAFHPPYHTRLALNRIEITPFRLKLMSADPDAKNPRNTRVQINMLDLRMPSQFVRLGDDIAGTHFTTLAYEEKSAPRPDGTARDVSELTIVNKKTGEKLILPRGVVVDSPENHAVIDYFWAPFGSASISEGKPSAVFHRRKGETFSIPPKTEDTYRVSAIRADAVDILLPSGETWTLHKAQR